MKILLVNSHGADLAFGGTERYVHDLRVGLEARGHRVTVLSAFPTAADSSSDQRVLHDVDWRDNRVRRYRNHAESWLASAPGHFEQMLRGLEPDLVHTSNLVGIGTGMWERSRRLGIPVVHTLHDYGLLCPRTSLMRRDGTPCRPSPLLCGLRSRRLSRWSPAVNAVVGVSAYVLDRHEDFFANNIPRHVIHPPLAPFTGSPRTSPGPTLRTLGFLGALNVEKGIPALLSVAPDLLAGGIQVRVAGDGPLRDAVAAAPAVDYVGPLLGHDLNAFLTSCDAGIVPSVWEEPGLTFVALEWLAAGRPVITSGRGGLAELEALGGVLRCAPTPEEIARVLTGLTHPRPYQRLADRVPAVREQTDVDRWLDAHLDLYEREIRAVPA